MLLLLLLTQELFSRENNETDCGLEILDPIHSYLGRFNLPYSLLPL